MIVPVIRFCVFTSLFAASFVAVTTTRHAIAVEPQPSSSLPEPTPAELPRWRGFNLLDNFDRGWSNEPFKEDDFRLIQKFGFNFVRLPLDYRIYTRDHDATRFDEAKLERIDQAIRWGKQYGIHVCLNLHRAPGYTVNTPPEPLDLWTDEKAQAQCAAHWAMFASRYQGIPSSQLSFNLLNEPPDSAGEHFVPVITRLVNAIREEDPDRLIISDGLTWGLKPVSELRELRVAQATRGYTPFPLTHYKAEWVESADQSTPPRWPTLEGGGLLCAPTKTEVVDAMRGPIRIDGPFDQPTRIRIRVDTVSSDSTLRLSSDTKKIVEKNFQAGPGEGPWKRSKYLPQWDTYQNTYDHDYSFPIPSDTKWVELQTTRGDWISISEIGLTIGHEDEKTIALQADWSQTPAQIICRSVGGETTVTTDKMFGREELFETTVLPWVKAKQAGIGAIVGEFGCYNRTPHDVTLAWMEDALTNWKHADMGWALWNFRGPFGILDSQRSDVHYESFEGHQLDRKMLELLQRH